MSREVCGICWCPYDDDTGKCECVPEPTPQRKPLLQAITEADRIMGHDDEATEWRERWAHLFEGLPQRPAEPVQEPQGCDHCNHPLYAAVKCRVCGRAHKIGGEG